MPNIDTLGQNLKEKFALQVLNIDFSKYDLDLSLQEHTGDLNSLMLSTPHL